MGDQREAPGDEGGGSERGVETCRILLWRGYTTCMFYAHASSDAAGASIVEPSSSFRSRRGAALDSTEARSAHLELVSRLKCNGWVEAGKGGEWYETEFARPVLVPSPTDADACRDDASPLLLDHGSEAAQPPPLSAPPEPRLPPPAPAPIFVVSRPRRRLDRWRVVAAAGLVTAIALLSWVATHPSAVGAAPLPQWAPEQEVGGFDPVTAHSTSLIARDWLIARR